MEMEIVILKLCLYVKGWSVPPSHFLTSLIPCMNGSGLDNSALADGGVGGVLLLMPTVARKQVIQAGTA